MVVIVTIIYLFSCLCCVFCATLNLNEGSPCQNGKVNGTCVSVYRCTTAAHTYLYLNAGLPKNNAAPFPVPLCNIKDGVPIVCCTDCKILETEEYKGFVVTTNGTLYKKQGPKSLDKFLDYFQYLPYKCRGKQQVGAAKRYNETLKCYQHYIPYLAHQYAYGGRDAKRAEFPHMALLGFGEKQEDAQWHCGGTIISERFILTAAHCLYSDVLASPVTFAALGILKRSDPLDIWKVYKLETTIRHPEYAPPAKYHDIALVKTENEINFNRYVLPACLDFDLITDANRTKAEAAGWGELGYKNSLADTLQIVTVDRFNESDCSENFAIHRHVNRGFDSVTQLCYGSQKEYIDTCRGDSGGPLQLNYEDCQFIIIGVTSFGYSKCATPGVPTIYTKVLYYVPWIESIVWPD